MKKSRTQESGELIRLAHGGGGALMHELIDSIFIKELSNDILNKKGDSAVFAHRGAEIAFTTDAFVVKPLFFPGGDIGSLAVYGTVNDLAVAGATPLYLSSALVIEEGLERSVLRNVVRSMAQAARRASVRIVTGDVKVVERGQCDKLFITTSGIGVIEKPRRLSIDAIRAGDAVIVNGTLGDHAISVLAERERLRLGSRVTSDASPLTGLVKRALSISGAIRFIRDATRGGLAATLNEIVRRRPFGIEIDEVAVPVREGVAAACELLGFNALSLANEGKAVFIVRADDSRRVVSAMRRHPLGKDAAVIGTVVTRAAGMVYAKTVMGSRKVVEMPAGELVPRIC